MTLIFSITIATFCLITASFVMIMIRQWRVMKALEIALRSMEGNTKRYNEIMDQYLGKRTSIAPE